ncbi:MAG: aldehyde dehydrogenase family protein [Akkermansiaceae bacterium]|nr:aldehyde dehydrogenase family protein [Akkermansiaceae bacterium]NNM28816.1 aldehyde dehydrogenase family protein [Akkermansiaceae bacterium]
MPTAPRDIARIFDSLGEFFSSGTPVPISYRRERLAILREELSRRSGEALAALASDLGKPALEAWLPEIYYVQSEIALIEKRLARWAKPRRVRNPFYFLPARSEIRQEPLGRVLIAAPWNYPLQLSLSPLIAAVAAGNCVVLKPSELAPATSRFLSGLIAAVFEPGHVAVVEGGAEAGAALLEHPFDHFFYTGGEAVGRLYFEAAARHLAPVTLELGGKCPCVIDSGVDLEEVVARVVAGKFFNAGQTCVAPDFVLVPASLHDDFVARTRAELHAAFGDSPSPDLARIVDDRHYQRLLDLLPPDAVRIGADDRDELYLAPRLIPDCAWDAPAMQEEIFGPVLPLIPYDDLDTVLRRLAGHPEPLAIYAFSPRRRVLEQVAASVRSGAVCFNDVMKPAANLRLPLGGVGASGMGRYHGHAGFLNFSYPRSVMRRWLLRDVFLVKPPYGNRLDWLQRFLGK